MERLTVASIGFGRQTWTMLCMMALGEMERPDLNIFADTHHEGQATYGFIRKWTPWLGEHGIDVVAVEGNRTEVVREDWKNGVLIPALAVNKATGEHGRLARECTQDWKIAPIRRYVRRELAHRGMKTHPGCVENWLGISWDESYRMKDSDVKYIVNRYPLVELRMTLKDCILWLDRNNLPVPPKSSCTFCPFRSRNEWKRMKRGEPTDWAEAVAVDRAIRNKRMRQYGPIYVHPARLPLPQAVQIPEDEGAHQIEMDFCEGGYCRV